MAGSFAWNAYGKCELFNLLIFYYANKFFLLPCLQKKQTRHVEISFREYCALDGDGFMGQSVALIADLSGMSRFIGQVAGIRQWKCCECGEWTRRKANGEIYEGLKS